MKHLKRYNESTNGVLDTIKDILIEVNYEQNDPNYRWTRLYQISIKK